MIDLRVSITGIEGLHGELSGLADQVPYATSLAIKPLQEQLVVRFF